MLYINNGMGVKHLELPLTRGDTYERALTDFYEFQLRHDRLQNFNFGCEDIVMTEHRAKFDIFFNEAITDGEYRWVLTKNLVPIEEGLCSVYTEHDPREHTEPHTLQTYTRDEALTNKPIFD